MASGAAAALLPIHGGLTALQGGLAARPDPADSPRDTRDEPSYQPSLFRDVLTGAKVIPIPTLTPLRMPGEARKGSTPRSVGPRPARRASVSLQTELFEPGQALAFAPPGESIYCDAPVASPQHRLVAAAVDAAVVLIALGVFLGMFVLCGGQMDLNRQMVMLLAGVGAVIGLFYHFLWCLADGDTPGMRFAGLRLVDFDGRTPDREKRSVRMAAALLSLLSAGLGLVWALVDEENLTWHDHISKTFPTAG
jgi:uncharacterized RDD family membrane protein YckC